VEDLLCTIINSRNKKSSKGRVMSKKLIYIVTLCLVLSFGISFKVSAEEYSPRDLFDDPEWGKWHRIHPEGNFIEEDREPVLPRNDGGNLQFSINQIYATGFSSFDPISPHDVIFNLQIEQIPQTGRGDKLYSGTNGFDIFFMVGISDDRLKRNVKEWIFSSSGIYLLLKPISENETHFALAYHYPGVSADEIERNEKSIDNLLQFDGISIPVTEKDLISVEFTKDDVKIIANGEVYSFYEISNQNPVVFEIYYHQKAYKALEGISYTCFAIYNSFPQFAESVMTIFSIDSTDPVSEEEVQYDAKSPENINTGSDTEKETTSRSLTDVPEHRQNNYAIYIGIGTLVVILMIFAFMLLKKSQRGKNDKETS